MIKFKSIQIKGYRGFTDSEVIPLNTPDGESAGSGLNIFVGENGGGKTTMLKAISLLNVNSFSGQSKISPFDFNNENDLETPIEITGELKDNVLYSMPTPYKKTLNIEKFIISIKHRGRKTPNKLLSPAFTISNILEPDSRTPEWFSGGELSDFFLGFDNTRFAGEEALNIFYFGSERGKQIKKGFSTTFSKLTDDLNWRFLKDAKQEEVFEKWESYYSEIVKDNHGKEIKKILKDKFGRDDLSKIKIELLKLKEPFSDSFFAIPGDKSLSQIPLSFLGSGVELLFSILFLREIAGKSKGTIVYCIDEPELSLHPQWQKVFFDILKEEAKTKQIFIATHSLHFIDKQLLGNTKRFYFEDGKIKYTNLSNTFSKSLKNQKLFFLENRELFFSRGVMLVEGIDDKVRLQKFLKHERDDLFIMQGLQNINRAKEACSQLKIPFKVMVDLDYLKRYKELMPSITAGELEQLEEIEILNKIHDDAKNEKVEKEIDKIKKKITETTDRCLSSKIKLKMDKDEKYKKEVEKKIRELSGDGFYVLSAGMIEDYLDEDGNCKDGGLKKELLKIVNS